MSGSSSMKYGGNTTCVEVITSNNHRIIIDAGTGIRELGKSLMKEGFDQGGKVVELFFTHFHWDHIQGFPFFEPAYICHEGQNGKRNVNTINTYSAFELGEKTQHALSTQMSDCFFPVKFNKLPAKITYNKLGCGGKFFGDTKVTACGLFHPGGAIAYRFDENGRSFVFATDFEHPLDGNIDKKLRDFVQGADIFAYDGQYRPDEYYASNSSKGKKGYGHSTPNDGIKLALAAGCKKLLIIHHDPSHDDKTLDNMEAEMRKDFKNAIFVKQGMEINL